MKTDFLFIHDEGSKYGNRRDNKKSKMVKYESHKFCKLAEKRSKKIKDAKEQRHLFDTTIPAFKEPPERNLPLLVRYPAN